MLVGDYFAEADEENLYQNVTSVKEPNTPTTVL